MYTNSIEDEMEFLVTLSKSNESLKVGDKVNVTKCPNCNNGTVITHCKDESNNVKFHHYCDSCGEVFDISKLKAELFFNAQYWTLKELNTPSGNIHVTVNNSRIYFRYLVSIYKNSDATSPFLVNKIEIDTSKLKINDNISCPFPKDNFHKDILNDMLICWHKDDTHLIAICTHLSHNQNDHCYTNATVSKHDISFTMVKEPYNNDNIVLAIVCLDTKLHANASISTLASIRDIWTT